MLTAVAPEKDHGFKELNEFTARQCPSYLLIAGSVFYRKRCFHCCAACSPPMALSAKCCASAVAICMRAALFLPASSLCTALSKQLLQAYGRTHILKDVADVAGAAAPTEASSSSLTSTTETVFIMANENHQKIMIWWPL